MKEIAASHLNVDLEFSRCLVVLPFFQLPSSSPLFLFAHPVLSVFLSPRLLSILVWNAGAEG